MSGRNRQPRGRAWGALAGTYPDPALGLPNSVGMSIFDDFIRDHTVTTSIGSNYGDTGLWQWASITGGVGGGTPTTVGPTNATEQGIFRVTSTANNGAGGRLASSAGQVQPAVGMIFAAKLLMSSGSTSYELASGLFTGAFTSMAVADAVNFIGIRSLGGNLFGVVKDGAAAGNESTVDLGFECEGTWRTAGWEYTEDGIQFFYLQTDEYVLERVDVGDPVATNIPTGNLGLGAIMMRALTNGVRVGEIDWWGLGGRIAR